MLPELVSGTERESMTMWQTSRVWLDGGAMFGKEGSGFQRVNVACPRKLLETALERIKAVL